MLSSSMLLLALLFVGTYGASVRSATLPKRDLHALSHANNHFAAVLHEKLADETEENVFFSPFSVSSVLAMVYSGARGETAKELRKVLGYGALNDSTIFSSFNYYLNEVIEKIDPKLYAISSVSAMVVDRSFPVLQHYKNNMQDVFQAYVRQADIADESAAVAEKINRWAKLKTKGAIGDLADNLDPETTLFLASAAYFKGAWNVKFDPQNTKYHPFYNGGLKTNASEVLMMHSHSSFRYYEGDEEGFSAIELYYEGRSMSMVIYLPNEYDGLRKLEGSMTAGMMSLVRRQMYYEKVHLTMPKFKLRYHTSLCRPLQDLGVTKIFRGTESDLSGMVAEGAALSLNEVKHKAAIEVNEQGSIATAFTRAIMMKSMPSKMPDPEFKVDHPFLFAIFDNRSNMIMFMGRVTNFFKQ